VKVIKAGVKPDRISPGKPRQNGRLERLHLTLLQDTAQPPARSLRQQIERKRFQRVRNEERPYAALGNDTPAQHYDASPRAWDGVLREPEHLGEHAIRRVRHNGEIKWRGNTIYIGSALVHEPIGLVENADGWAVSYGPIALGTIAHASPDRLRKPKRRRCGLVDNASALPTTPQHQQQKQS
jgi:putative transposase